MAEQRQLWWSYNEGYKEAMVVLVGYAFPMDEEPLNEPTFKVEYDIPKPSIIPSGPQSAGSAAPADIVTKNQSDKLGLQFFACTATSTNRTAFVYGGFEQLFFVGKVRATVVWKSKSGQDYEAKIEFDAKDVLNKPQAVTVGTVPVELTSLLVSECQPSEEGTATVAYTTSLDEGERAAAVGDILVHLENSLERGLGDLWKRADPIGCCHNGSALRDYDLKSGLTREKLLECWAQHATELLIGCPYDGGASNMGVPEAPGISGSHGKDAYLAMACVAGPRLLVPLMFQCQQLSTMVLLCLGLDEIAKNPIDSHDVRNGNLPGKTVAFDAAGLSAWADGGWPSAKKAVDQKLARVGTCFYYQGDGGTPGTKASGDDFPHVAATLRVGRMPQRLQLLDTGAWVYDSHGRLKAKSGGGGYMYDTAWVSTLKKSDLPVLDPVTQKVVKTIKFEFTGVMQPPVVADSDLIRAIERMRTARMLGAARLVVKERKTGNVWWVSQLLPMERNSKPYSFARLMASLRGCPHRKDVEVTWQVIMPSATATMQKPDGTTVPWDQTFWATWIKNPTNLTSEQQAALDRCAAKNCLEDGTAWWREGTILAVAAITIGSDGKPFFAWKEPPMYVKPGFRARFAATDSASFSLTSVQLMKLRKDTNWPQFADMSSQDARIGEYFKGV